MVLFLIDCVHERKVKRTRYHLEIAPRARTRWNTGGYEAKHSGRFHKGHPVVVNAGSLETCRRSSAHSEKVLAGRGCIPLAGAPVILPNGGTPNDTSGSLITAHTVGSGYGCAVVQLRTDGQIGHKIVKGVPRAFGIQLHLPCTTNFPRPAGCGWMLTV
jgi:hypothetical protein